MLRIEPQRQGVLTWEAGKDLVPHPEIHIPEVPLLLRPGHCQRDFRGPLNRSHRESRRMSNLDRDGDSIPRKVVIECEGTA